jgi:FHA domain/Transposase domain (DUF772)
MDMSTSLSAEQFLAQVGRLIEWEELTSEVNDLSCRIEADVPLPAIKMHLLARWYGMNDAAIIDAIQDRISFRRFLSLPFDQFDADARIAEAYLRGVKLAPVEVQVLVHAVESQLLAKGYTIRTGMSADAVVAPVLRDRLPDVPEVSKTVVFQPGDLAKIRDAGESLVARGAEHVTGDLPALSNSAPLVRLSSPEMPAMQCMIEWPWGESTHLKERLNIGRDYTFCPYASQLQNYRHVSRVHAELASCSAGIWVRDLRSRNGTFINDEEIPKGQAFLVDANARLRCGPNFVAMLTLGR